MRGGREGEKNRDGKVRGRIQGWRRDEKRKRVTDKQEA